MDTNELPNQGYTKDFSTGAKRDGDDGRGRPKLYLRSPYAVSPNDLKLAESFTETTTEARIPTK